MKEKIIDFSNGIISYDQVGLKTEPDRLSIELEPNGSAKGSLIVSSLDERRVRGFLVHHIPGLTFGKSVFFGRAARLEYECEAEGLRPGEDRTGSLWLESNGGEYEIPVEIRVRGPKEEPEEEIPMEELPCAGSGPEPLRRGRGRSEEWKRRRAQENALARIRLCVEKEKRRALKPKEAAALLREQADLLLSLDPDSGFYALVDAWAMVREGRTEEAGWSLRRYEKARLFQQWDVRSRVLFLYVNSLCRNSGQVTAQSVSQLQRLYQKHPEDWMLTMALLALDPDLKDDPRTRFRLLERQFRSGTRSRLLYQAAWELLKDDPALFPGLDPFMLQTFSWAASRGFLTAETARQAAGQAARLRRWSPMAARLLKACYQVSPDRETAGAVCAICIRGHRTDPDAFVWYQKGVELDAKITNLYEYFMYALPEDYPKLLPRQVILYFSYHNTLTARQKTGFYRNLVRYGAIGQPEYEEHRRLLQEFLLKQVRERRISEELAWLYGRCLIPETLEEDELSALADLLFVRKLTCAEKRILQVEVSYDQLEEPFVTPLQSGAAYVPVYTPNAKITLVDGQGRRYRKTVPYDMKRLLIEPKFLMACTMRLKKHLGLNLYLLEGKGERRLRREHVETAYCMLEEPRIKESYRQKLKLELLEYERRRRRLESEKGLDERLLIERPDTLPREGQAAYIEAFILLKKDREALELLRQTGCTRTDPKLLLRLLQRLLAEQGAGEEELRPYARQIFGQGVYTERIVALLASEARDSLDGLLALWKAAQQFGLILPELEETLVVQALFTERRTPEVYPVFASMDDRGADPVVVSAYLNYLAWQDFVKDVPVPDGFFESLEHHLLWEDHLSRTAELSFLRQVSAFLLLTDAQKRLVRRLMEAQEPCRYRFAFMEKLYPYRDDRERRDDRTVVEYRCSPSSKVILHYVLEYHGKRSFDYVTERLFPVCGGVYVRAFTLFYGERLTWFFTEERPDGSSSSTACRTVENRQEKEEGGSRYERLCRMQRALDFRQDRQLRKMMAEYEALLEITQEQFVARQGEKE
ncbi:MAG: DUF5717 family protein [Eubacteriales bacterium]|nr:DUF5717 family protein [Eubacteriales bacterium]